MSAAELDRAVTLLVRQVGHWQQPRWSAPAEGGNVSRADLVHKLVQELANLAADVAGEPRREVPRLPSDLALTDQLRVVAADLALAAPPEPVLAGAAEAVTRTRSAL
ncbi:hypothetical protein O7602_24195 [Micromonospora sp. WMMD1128]|uniref:hypothetical protein n=1 Tax=Micromonospora sp. WMMD1128 TaxID=3015150 RepID=UPI00248BCD1E|nr:hypothetical protein [Micromonospora sp. WMMD1128]WBB72772.1 hypothetical protein O7602_24195 [Micromonospora sp. WMMD1128]